MKVRKRIRTDSRLRKAFLGLCAAVLIFSGVPAISLAEEDGTSDGKVVAEQTAADAGETPSDDQPSSNGAADQKTDKASDSAFPSGNADQFADPANEDNAEVEKDTSQEGSIRIEALADEVDNEKAAAEEAAPLAASPLRSVSGGVGTLNVQLSNAEGGWDDVSSYENGTVDWSLEKMRTLRVNYEFGSGSNKSIVVSVPKGYQITGYTATDDTPAMDGVDKITIDPQYSASFQASTLKAADGSSSWESQVISGYTAKKSTSEVDQRVYAGVASYAFASSATAGSLVFTLKPQSEVMAHTAESEELEDINVTMSSDKGSIGESFHANVTEVAVPYIKWPGITWGRQYSNAIVDSETGLSESFGVWFYSQSYWEEAQPYLSDQILVEIEYPKGVYFDHKILGGYAGMSGDLTISSNPMSYGSHFTIKDTGNVNTGGSVIMQMDKTTFYDAGWNCDLGAYFVADTTTGFVSKGDRLSFPITISNNNQGKHYSFTDTSYRTLLDQDKFYMGVWSKNVNRWDIIADYPNFDRPYVMGGFALDAYTSYKDINLHFDYSGLSGVQGMFLPGYNIRNIEVKTNLGNTYTIETLSGHGSSHGGVALLPEKIGLADGEYIETLDCLVDLEQMTYGMGHIYSFTYTGHFVDGQEGDAVFSVVDKDGNILVNGDGDYLTTTDHTTIRYDDNAAGYCDTTTTNYGEADAVFYPNDTIYFKSYVQGGYDWASSTTIIDPTIMISLPEGINLDTSSVESTTWRTNPEGVMKSLVQTGTPKTEVINGTKWTTYYYTSANPMDMVAYERGAQLETQLEVFFEAHVASNCPQYGQISLGDCVQWDLGQTGAMWTDRRAKDEHNRAGKGTDYWLYQAGGNYAVKDLIGLNVDLGIRVKDSGTDFFTYDTTENSIAALSKTKNAEVRIGYENTGSSDYLPGSTIYLPIPKTGHNYSRYFQNIELKDPLNTQNNKEFEFNTNLQDGVDIAGFDTYYSVDAVDNAEAYDPSTNAGTWAPVTTANWYSASQLSSAGLSYSDVTMLKFVARDTIPSGANGNATFELAIDGNARVGQLDYWRAYTKAVTNSSTNAGVWFYSSVLAATPASDGLHGFVFIDNDDDGLFDAAAGDEAYADQNITAILSRDDGTMPNLGLSIQSDGSFRSLNESGGVYYLRPGDYTIDFTCAEPALGFSTIHGSDSSSSSAWYNDLSPADIDNENATYRFTVGDELATYVGVALTSGVEVISVDVPVRVNIALNTDGTWCTPTALRNRIINRSTCAMHVASAVATTKSDFGLQSTSDFTTSGLDNALAGTITPANSAGATTGTPQDLTSISTAGDKWTMPLGQTRAGVAVADGTNELPLQLAGSIRSVEGHYFTAPINVFDITYTFEKAGE